MRKEGITSVWWAEKLLHAGVGGRLLKQDPAIAGGRAAVHGPNEQRLTIMADYTEARWCAGARCGGAISRLLMAEWVDFVTAGARGMKARHPMRAFRSTASFGRRRRGVADVAANHPAPGGDAGWWRRRRAPSSEYTNPSGIIAERRKYTARPSCLCSASHLWDLQRLLTASDLRPCPSVTTTSTSIARRRGSAGDGGMDRGLAADRRGRQRRRQRREPGICCAPTRSPT
jgi:hypothetical protein